ncbi:MAG: hypothetical protein Q8K45_22000 [Rubrivivax sp.]|nr:hypothetical protein [Rubrivivax sp.]
MNPAPLHCRHCNAPLDMLSRRRGLPQCQRAACRAKVDQADLGRRWQRVGTHALQRATVALEPEAAPPVLLHLESAWRTLVPVSDADRDFLSARWRRAWDEGQRSTASGTDSAADTPPDAAALCGHCAGRCCTHGAASGAFVDARVLQRWLDAHPCATLDDAIADHLALLPAEHVQGQCCYQTASGCALPRDRRADICNVYRCDALATLARHITERPDVAAVVVTRQLRRVEAVVVFRHGRATPLAGVPQPDDLPA